jgi:hypothetical protein
MNGRSDDVRRRLSRELNNPFAEIGFYRRHAFCLERGVEMNFFCGHALRFDHAGCIAFAQ